MTIPAVAPYGSWKSPLQAAGLVSASLGLSQIRLDGGDIFWNEQRPNEGGRGVVVCMDATGRRRDLVPPPFNARTRVHEYGGMSYVLAGEWVVFSNFADQRLYRVARAGGNAALVPITPAGWRYADGIWDAGRGRIIMVREDHSRPGEPVNTIVAVDPRGDGSGTVLVEGESFYAAPRLSPDGSKLAWLSWNHPAMPWDSAGLFVAPVRADGSLGTPAHVAGGADEAITVPAWSPEGTLFFVSDRTDWWNLYCLRAGRVEPVTRQEAEFADPMWVLGEHPYDFVDERTILAAYTSRGLWRVARVDVRSGQMSDLDLPYCSVDSVHVCGKEAVLLAGSPAATGVIVRVDLATGRREVVQRSLSVDLDPKYLSAPEPVEFPTAGGQTAFGIFYPPANADFAAPAGEKPPLLVKIHGGPTAATGAALRRDIQYYTSRGWAVLDVNYGGSTGYGRAYRRRLNGQWGIVDVDDCCFGAKWLAEQGRVDGTRLAITGGSAGGYTTLAALAFRDVFSAGSSHFGVSDCEILAQQTHKFESRYLDTLIGPYPQERELYVARSPIHHAERITCPVIFFQGLEDKIVPPNQARMMFDALRGRGIATALVEFEGEQHGFRQAANIVRALEGEYDFFARVFGFTPADRIEPVKIENDPRSADRV